MREKAKAFFKRYFIDAMSHMALGLFSSLIIGLILSQLSAIPFLSFLKPLAAIVSASSPVVGAAIGVAIAYGLKVKPLAVFSCAVAGAYGYQLGGPVGAYLAVVAGAECGSSQGKPRWTLYWCPSLPSCPAASSPTWQAQASPPAWTPWAVL